MAYPHTDSPRQNGILAALPLPDYDRIAGELEPVDLVAGQVIEEPGATYDFVYFPVSCTASLVSSTQDGDMSELAITGQEGLVGVSSVLGMPSANHRVMVMCAGQAYRLPALAFESALAQSESLRRLTLRYVQALMSQMAQSIVCSRHHSVLQRLSYWLLFNQDRANTDQLKVTHELVAHMLGVRRESITQAAGVLQSSGWIRTSRGKIHIENPEGLGARACECYGLLKQEYARLHAPLQHPAWAPRMAFTDARAPGDDAAFETRVSDGAAGDRKYEDIYDFAPVGLLSLGVQGQLLELNMAGAIMLGIQRSRSSRHLFADFLSEDSRSDFAQFHAEVMSGKCRRHCDLQLKPNAQRPEMVVRVAATVDEDGVENRMVMTDITEQVQQARDLAAREREQRALLEHLPGVFWIKNEMGQFVAVHHLADLSLNGAGSNAPVDGEGEGVHHYGTPAPTETSRAAGLKN